MSATDQAITPVDPDGNPFTPDCPGREVFNHITSRWALLILMALGQSPLRFHALRDSVGGISEKMLSQTLKVLARDGLVQRSVVHSSPPQVTYRLSDMGHELSDHFLQLIHWLGRRVPDIIEAQEQYDRTSQPGPTAPARAGAVATTPTARGSSAGPG